MRRIGLGLFLFLIYFTLIKTAVYAGGELGNPKFVAHENIIAGFTTEYPETWHVFDQDERTSFVQMTELHETPSGVSITAAYMESVTSVEALRKYLSAHHPTKKWEKIKFADYPAYKTEANLEGMIYLFRGVKDVIFVTYQQGETLQANYHLYEILKRVKIN